MTSSSIIVRPLASDAERELQFQLADQAFSTDPSPSNAAYWEQLITTLPEHRPEQLRGAFRNGEQLGGYIMYERVMRMGVARLLTGCIGAVVTHTAYRNQRVATALLQDATNYALSHNHALLLLDGIPKFYHRFGYSDMFDLSTQEVVRAAILAQPPSTHRVRHATLEDASDVLALYDRHYGSFTRTVEQQIHRLQYRSPDNPMLLAVNAAGQVQGYLALQRPDRSVAWELAADNWMAALALLQYHAKLLDGPEAPFTLRYRLPLTSPIAEWMIDHLEVPDTSQWRSPAEEWGIRSETYHHRDTGWMARLVRLSTVMQAILPELEERWKRSLAQWSGDISLIVGEETYMLGINGTELHYVDKPGMASNAVRFTPEAFVQVIFGYRSIAWAMQNNGQRISSDLLTVLNVLFPVGHTWIPASDAF